MRLSLYTLRPHYGDWSMNRALLALTGIAALAIPTALFAADPSHGDRYFLGLLDHRSRYGQGWFPEPLCADELDAESELRLDWFHGEDRDRQADEVKAEFEWNFGNLTLEVES